MFGFLRNFSFDRNSFWIGVIVGTLLWWLISVLRPYIRRGWAAMREQFQKSREGLQTTTEIRLANDTLKRVQSLHLAAPLFSLDEIRIEPRVLAPPAVVEPGEDPHLLDIVGMTIPYTPDWPELAGAYNRRTLSLPEALSGGANLLLMGKPGAGKTFALADLASRVARRDDSVGELSRSVPLYLHAFDLNPELENDWGAADALIQAASENASTLTNRQLPKFLQSALNLGRVLLLLDGLDEVSTEEFDEYTAFLVALLEDYPDVQIMVSVSTEYQGELRSHGFAPVTIAPWNNNARERFINHWAELWIQYVNADIWPPEETIKEEAELLELFSEAIVDPYILNGYLISERRILTPLELTLKVWATYAGDLLGDRIEDDLEAYLRRMTTQIPTGISALEQLAIRMVRSEIAVIGRDQVDAAIDIGDGPLPLDDLDEAEPSSNGSGDPETIGEESASKVSVRRVLSKLVNEGLLNQWPDGRVSFFHPVVMGYMAGCSLARSDDNEFLLSQGRWIGRSLTLEFLAACGEVSSLAVQLIDESVDPLQEGLFTVASWLRNAPKADNWRSIVMRRLAKLIQNEIYAISKRARALGALAVSGDKDVAVLFRHLLNSDQPTTRQLAVLGLGFIRDTESVSDLSVKLYDPSPNVFRASALALVNIGTEEALEQTASALLHGEEEQRRAAAEAFANHPEEGYPILMDGIGIEDLLVRRAVVYGLQRVREPWALEALNKIQVDDDQWVVRNAANQAVEELERPDHSVPKPDPPLHELPWLIAFAGERGMGITAGKPAAEMLRLALKDGNLDEKLAALHYVHTIPDTSLILGIYGLLYDNDEELREAAYLTLWDLNVEGIELPSPTQYGVG